MFGLDEDQTLRLVYLTLLLVFLVGSAGFGRFSMLRHLGIWALVVVALVTAYAYRDPLMRFAAPVLQELDPSRVVEVTDAGGARELVIGRGADGHFQLDAAVNGVPVRFLVDTGASTTVLTLADAERAGIEIAALRFNRPVQTANGVAMFARATLDTLEIGPYRLASLPVGVMPGETLSVSLLGMSTIDRFAGWRVEGNRMVLVP
ncbi:MAG TPA: TIGR02281 family clan AA aspartic protease [Propylenella sp.]